MFAQPHPIPGGVAPVYPKCTPTARTRYEKRYQILCGDKTTPCLENVRNLVFYNLTNPEPVFTTFGMQYPDNPSFYQHFYNNFASNPQAYFTLQFLGSENDAFSHVTAMFVYMLFNKGVCTFIKNLYPVFT